MSQLKDIYFNPSFYHELTQKLATIYPKLDGDKFFRKAVEGLEELELKARIRHTSELCFRHLPNEYDKALDILYLFSEGLENNFSYMFMPDFVARYGHDHYELSMEALRDFTPYSSSELAVRSFLESDFEKTLEIMKGWTEHKNYHVRRLASEGSRPRLPWASRVRVSLEQPHLAWPILEALKGDDETYIKKSVANHINDISKDHPDWLVKQLKNWDQAHCNTGWIIRHGSRTLIKQAHPGTMKLLGFQEKPLLDLKNFQLDKDKIKLGESIVFSCNIQAKGTKPQKLALDYKVHYVKANGKLNPKVFKLKETTLTAGQTLVINKTHRFKAFTTRKHYPGTHKVELLANGESLVEKCFELEE